MTTEALRKVIKVTSWFFDENGLTILYERADSTPQQSKVFLNIPETLKVLWTSGSLDDYNGITDMGLLDGNWYSYHHLMLLYKMCQWEALAIVIRHEEEKELANDMNLLELDAAINALK